MYIFIIIFPIFLHADSYNFFDFGVKAKEYKIMEEDYRILMKRKVNELNITKIKKNMLNVIDNIQTASVDIDRCSKNSYIDEEDSITAPFDVKSPSGEVLINKGERLTVPENIQISDVELCIVDSFVDGSINEESMIDDINNLYKLHKDCVFLINNYSLREFQERFPQVKKVYSLSQSIVKRFKIDCSPAFIGLHRNRIERNFYYFEDKKEDGR